MPARPAVVRFSRFLFAVLFALTLAGCTAAVDSYNLIDIQDADELTFLVASKVCYSVDFAGGLQTEVFVSSKALIGPSFSQNGRGLAVYNVGTDRLPYTSRNVRLEIRSPDGLSSCPLSQFDDPPIRILDFIPPIWEPRGGSMLVAHGKGLDRVTVDGYAKRLLSGEMTTAAAVSPNGNVIAVANEKGFYLIDRDGSPVPGFELDPDITSKLYYRFIRSMAFSGDGTKLLFSQSGDIFVLDLSSGEPARIHTASLDVYWLAWTPGDAGIVFLSGRARRRSPTHGSLNWSSTAEGNYRLYSLSVTGEGPRLLYRENSIDVRNGRPSLSPDGRYVAIVANPGRRTVMVVAVDGHGVMPFPQEGPASHPVWRP